MKEGGTLSDWQRFVILHGWRAESYYLAAVTGRQEREVLRLRATKAGVRRDKPLGFADLFALWHGRPPEAADWPPPRKLGKRTTYEWQPPEAAVLATLIGELGYGDIAKVLTARLRQLTGDRTATRSREAVAAHAQKVGLQSSDVVGGLTTAEAGKEIGSVVTINRMISNGQLKAVRKGRHYVIPYKTWAEWKSRRTLPPAGYVRLSSIRESLSIASDKLSEYARMNLIPTAIRCNPYGTKGGNTQFGTWWLSAAVAAKLVADRKAGLPMPWQGRYEGNLRLTFKRWHDRKHPMSCETCAVIWGQQGAPRTFEDFARRYPDLAHGAKRHLTRPWSPGMTVQEVAEYSNRAVVDVKRAITAGMLATTKHGRRTYVTRTAATLWITRKCPLGDGKMSWIAIDTACDLYFFTRRELNNAIEAKQITTRLGDYGAQRGVLYLSRQQCAELRERIGFTEAQAARRLGVTVARLRHVLDGVNWRKAPLIPLVTLQAVRKRLDSSIGITLEEAAKQLKKPLQWVQARVADGTVKVRRARWDPRRLYLNATMLKRLREAASRQDETPKDLGEEWLHLSDAAMEAGVSAATLIKWALTEDLKRRESPTGWRYHRAAVRAQARRYWPDQRLHRASPPDWLQKELSS